MGATRAKTEYLTKVRLERFLSRNLPNVWLVTMTFHENVIVKKEAMKRWKPVADWLKRHACLLDHLNAGRPDGVYIRQGLAVKGFFHIIDECLELDDGCVLFAVFELEFSYLLFKVKDDV